ncbi:MAG: hypothetical protein ACRBBM_05110 [Pseudomonadaceae bacterium]
MEEQSFTPIADARNRGLFPSNDNLARQLITDFSDLEWPSARSLGTKIGEIDRGTRTWWLHRPDFSKALAEHLGLTLFDLGLEFSKDDKLFPFSDFPELPALKLGAEAPCLIADVVDDRGSNCEGFLASWLAGYQGGIVRNPTAGISWLEIPRGSGLSLFCAQLEACGRFEFRRVNYLHEASLPLNHVVPLAVQLDQSLSKKDLLALATIHQDKPFLIVASFPPPVDLGGGGDIYTHWEFQAAKGVERRQLLLTSSYAFANSIQKLKWQLFDDWQDRLLGWVEARLRSNNVDTLFTAEGLKRWLRKFEAIQSGSYTPKVLLTLCRFCHNAPETQLPSSAAPDAGAKLMKILLHANAEQTTLASTMIARHFRERGNPWGQPISLEQWAAISPDGLSIPTSAELRAIANAGNAIAREKAVQLLETKLLSRRAETLIACGLLSITSTGAYLLQPQFLVDMVARDQMIALASDEPATAWALLCFDPARRHVVDAALAQCSVNQLLPIAEAIGQLSPNDPKAITLSETLFITLGERLNGEFSLPREFVHIGDRVYRRLKSAFFQPSSRPWESRSDQLRWQAACWAWSLMAESPAGHSEVQQWLFPGWSEELGEDGKAYLVDSPQPTWKDSPILDPQWTRMLEVAEYWVASLEAAPYPSPAFCAPLLLREASLGRWPIQQIWWHEVLEFSWASEYLIKHSDPAAACNWTIALLPSFIQYSLHCLSGKDSGMAHLKIFGCGVFQWLLSNIREDQFLECLQEAETDFLLRHPLSLPPNLRRLLLQPSILRGRGHMTLRQMQMIVEAIEEPEALVGLIDTWPTAPSRLWEVAPQLAEDILTNTDLHSFEEQAFVGLLLACPSLYVETAIDHLMRRPTLDQNEVLDWVIERLRSTGSSAEALLNLAQQATAAIEEN